MKNFILVCKYSGVIVLLCMALFLPLAAHGKTIPQLAAEMGAELDAQLGQITHKVTMIVTTPVNLRDLNESSGLGLQLSEEFAYYFVSSGYRVQEIRKGAGLLFDEVNGEMLLTRDPSYLANTDVDSAVVMVGTYVRTNRSVRVNIRLVHTPSNEVLAMSSGTIPLSSEVRALLMAPTDLADMGHVPSIGTKLNPNGVQNTAYDVEPGLPPASETQVAEGAEGKGEGEAPKTKGDSTIDTFLSSFNQSPPGP